MEQATKFSRSLTADEVAALVLPPDSESPTTSLVDVKSKSTAEAHFPGIAPSVKSDAGYDTVPDPKPLKEK
jgi:hypothetical protein